jgi:hypothetical protein
MKAVARFGVDRHPKPFTFTVDTVRPLSHIGIAKLGTRNSAAEGKAVALSNRARVRFPAQTRYQALSFSVQEPARPPFTLWVKKASRSMLFR